MQVITAAFLFSILPALHQGNLTDTVTDRIRQPPEIAKAVAALADLRVYIDFDDDPKTFAVWPVDKFGRKLPADEIARGVRLGLSLWASVLPDMHFRFVDKTEGANLLIRFGPYARSGFGDAGGRAFLPSEWNRLDVDCGRFSENKRPDGSGCSEWSGNIITLQSGRWAVKRMDFRGMRETWLDFQWIYDPGRRHYRWKNGVGTAPGSGGVADDGAGGGGCGLGGGAAEIGGGSQWDQTCVDFSKSPYFDSLAGADLAAIFQHEFGHSLMGPHTESPYECVDYARRPILSADSCVRRVPGRGFSVMFPGDGVDGGWNRRGIFAVDAARLKSLGYHTCYPASNYGIVLARPGGAEKIVRDWREAERLLIWPLRPRVLTVAESRREWFVVDLRLDGAGSAAAAPRADRPGFVF